MTSNDRIKEIKFLKWYKKQIYNTPAGSYKKLRIKVAAHTRKTLNRG